MSNTTSSDHFLKNQTIGLLKPLTLAISACFLTACGTTGTTTPATTVKPITVINHNNTYNGVLDEATLNELEDLLQATDMSMVEGDALTVQRYGNLWDRIRRGYRMGETHNARIEAQKSWFYSRQSYLDRLTARASRYLHHTVTEAERRGIPTELALLPIIESSYDPSATSNAAAAGLWQFIPSTGRIYGLNQSTNYDGRRDIIESTRAAYDFLTSLYNQFGSWELALAAYNAGPGRISRAIKANEAAGLPTDYWSLKLPTETMNYVPRFLAVSQIVASPASYGVSLPAIANHTHFRTVPANYGVSLQEVSVITGVPFDELRLLNPALKNFSVDAAGPSRIVIPNSVSTALDEKISALSGNGSAYVATAPAQSTQYVVPNTGVQTNTTSQQELMQSNTLPTTIAQITPNNTIVQEPPLTQEERDFIAAQIQSTNTSVVQAVSPTDGNIQLNAVQTAQSVLESRGQSKTLNYSSVATTQPAQVQPQPQLQPVHTQASVIANPAAIEPNSTASTAAINNTANQGLNHGTPAVAPTPAPVRTPKPTTQPAKPTQAVRPAAKPESYTVQAGDTLTGIAQANNLTVSQLASYNNIATDTMVQRGQKLWLVSGKVKTQPAQSTPKPTAPAIKTTTHRVQAGESLTVLARKYDMSVQDLAALNGLEPTQGLYIGQSIKVPAAKATTTTAPARQPAAATKATKYTVKSGDSLTSVANKHGISIDELAAANNLSRTANLVLGTTITIPAGTQAKPQTTQVAPVSKSTTPTENYTVQAGDNLTKIAGKYGVAVSELAKMNNLKTNASLRQGQTIKVPKLTTTYKVKSGDNLNTLARRYGISVDELAKMNNLNSNANLRIGQTLTVPNK